MTRENLLCFWLTCASIILPIIAALAAAAWS